MTEAYIAAVIPAKAGIQVIIKYARSVTNPKHGLVRYAGLYPNWIPAFAGMTGFLVLHAVFIYVKLNN
jgi:hypothetical protein